MPQTPRYERFLERLFDEAPRIARYVPRHYFQDRETRDLIRFLFAEHQEYAGAVDAVMRRWIAQGDWPAHDSWADSLRYLIGMRLSCAMDTLNLLLQETASGKSLIPAPPDEVPDDTLLTWLLIDSWNGWRWDTWLKLEALRVDGGDDSFYGLGKD